ncbi:polygalacturonase-like [Argentina anserina]|uniref:polygalacturonase-like n=1 Tax=Argentina anserina TaxID=57926 RepID=UPI0021767C54|nr:polygalacturonase-like [Potentilla anserina]
MEGPCRAPIQFQIQGTLQAPKDRSQLDESWVYFRNINMLTLTGGGTFDGQGELSWMDSTPVDISFKTVNNSIISGLTFMDSAKFHIKVHDSNNVKFQRVTITAPEDSPNTDGIHIAKSSRITVSDSNIATGDDCVSTGDGSSQILVSNINCGPGHGISIGSLGKYENEQPVVGITVKNCTLTCTTNGARVKTWPDSPGTSVATNILSQDIIMVNVKNPILINQNYCDRGKSCDIPQEADTPPPPPEVDTPPSVTMIYEHPHPLPHPPATFSRGNDRQWRSCSKPLKQDQLEFDK